MKYTIRIDAKVDEVEDSTDSTMNRLIRFLDDTRYTSCLVYREVSSEIKKLHYQGVLEVDEKDTGWHRERWCRLFSDYKKGSKSSALMKKDQYEVYITKDKDQIYMRGYTEEYIKELESKSYTKEVRTKTDYYDRFIKWLWKYDHKTDTWKYDRYYIAEKLIEFFGVEKQEIKNFNFYRSLIFNVQAQLLANDSTQKAKESRILLAGRILDG